MSDFEWSSVPGVDGPPVQGDSGSFTTAADEVAGHRAGLEDILADVDRVKQTVSTGFSGHAGDAFTSLIDQAIDRHASLPAQLSDVEAALRTHAQQLDLLTIEASRHLKAAELVQADVKAAEDALEVASARAEAAGAALSASSPDDPGYGALQEAHAAAIRAVGQAREKLGAATEKLAGFAEVHAEIADEEARLNGAIATILDGSPIAVSVTFSNNRSMSWFDPVLAGNPGTAGIMSFFSNQFHRERDTADGDLGGQFTTVERDPFSVAGADGNTRGIAAVVEALEDTADSSQLRRDEFEIVDHNNGSYTVVLPGVADLTQYLAGLGLSEYDATVRDTDVYAARSATSAEIADNFYAELVRDYVLTNVPAGSDVLIVGHSFGGDTALDLASDPTFNGPAGVNVTHVVAAAYNSEPQIAHVVDGTEVLVLQNDIDLPVIAERVLEEPGIAAFGVADAVESAGDLDLMGTLGGLQQARSGTLGTLSDGIGFLADITSPFSNPAGTFADPDFVVAVAEGDQSQIVANSFGIFTEEGVTHHNDHIAQWVVSGDFAGGGHEQSNYITAIEEGSGDAAVDRFFADLDAEGYTANGTSLAVDVSVE